MSTVGKTVADAIIAGEYAEEGWFAIVKYQNMFDGRDAYKLVRSQRELEWVLNEVPTMINPTVYWRSGRGKV